MAVTNAISSVIIVGALIAVGPTELDLAKVLGFIAMTLAAVNIFGGFTVTHRMLRSEERRVGKECRSRWRRYREKRRREERISRGRRRRRSDGWVSER